jgi:hypothetical protein
MSVSREAHHIMHSYSILKLKNANDITLKVLRNAPLFDLAENCYNIGNIKGKNCIFCCSPLAHREIYNTICAT